MDSLRVVIKSYHNGQNEKTDHLTRYDIRCFSHKEWGTWSESKKLTNMWDYYIPEGKEEKNKYEYLIFDVDFVQNDEAVEELLKSDF